MPVALEFDIPRIDMNLQRAAPKYDWTAVKCVLDVGITRIQNTMPRVESSSIAPNVN